MPRIETRPTETEQAKANRMQDAGDGLKGHIDAQIKAGHYRPDEALAVLEEVVKYVKYQYRIEDKKNGGGEQHEEQQPQ